jgi:hypothetical protein
MRKLCALGLILVAAIGCQNPVSPTTAPATGAGSKAPAAKQDAASIYKKLDTKNEGTITLAQFEAISKETGNTNEAIATTEARTATYKKYAGDKGMTQEEFTKMWDEINNTKATNSPK